MEKIKRILFIHHAASWGGAPKSMIQLINALDKTKYAPHVLLFRDSIVAEKLRENNISYSIAKSKFYKKFYNFFTHSEADYVKWFQLLKFFKLSLLWLLSRYYYANKELESIDFDIVHLNSSVLTDWLALVKRKGKVIIHIREPFRLGRVDILAPFFRHQMSKYADKIIAISNDNAKRIALKSKTEVIYNFTKVLDDEPYKESYSSKRFLYLGGDARIKGFNTLVKALDYLDKDIIVVFAGHYQSSKDIKNPVKRIVFSIFRYKKYKNVEIVKKHKNAEYKSLLMDISDEMEHCCCTISPFSKPHFSRPVIEAYMYRKPAIGSNVDGMDEIIIHNDTGLLFKKDNQRDLANSINYLANNPVLAMEMGNWAYEIARKVYSSDNVKEFEKIYKLLLFNN